MAQGASLRRRPVRAQAAGGRLAAVLQGTGRRPKFKGRGSGMGFTVPDKVRIRNGRIAVPRIGDFRLRRRGGNPHPDGVPKQAVFKPEGGKWFCTVFYEVKVEARADDGSCLGVDRNVGQCALSTGEIIRMPDLSRLEARRRRYQRRMARQAKGGGRRQRTRGKLSRTCRRIASVRSNWCHQASRRISDAAHTAVVEDLNTKGMTRSAKGTEAAPGRRVKAKSGLNRAILSSGWGSLERNLDYKAGQVVRINPAHTSQTCHACGCVGCGQPAKPINFSMSGLRAHGERRRERGPKHPASGIGAAGRRGPWAQASQRLVGPPRDPSNRWRTPAGRLTACGR